MKLSKKSKEMLAFFTNNTHLNTVKQTTKTDDIVIELYNDIYDSYKNLISLKKKGNYYKLIQKKITNSSQITKPTSFPSKSFPYIALSHIDKNSLTELSYSFSLFERTITLHFVVEEHNKDLHIDTYNHYVDTMVMWFYILHKYASHQCAKSLTIYLYFTSLEKKLPDTNMYTLDENHINTAFTTTCPEVSEIVIYRKEEWFKVLIHETFHNFALDFSNMNNTKVNDCILNIFKVTSEVNLFEAYTEIWAELINALFCSFFVLKDKTNIDEMLSRFEYFVNFERRFSYFQLIKTLQFMGLTYKDLYSDTKHSRNLREKLYKEKTSVLSYYVIKTILINNYQGFLHWCKTNNFSLLDFNKTISNQREFCNFIQKNYKSTSMIQNVIETQQFLTKLNGNKMNKNLYYVLSNLRMSICELI